MVYIDINRSNTHADPPLGSRWAQMWVHMWVHTLVILLVYVTTGNNCLAIYRTYIADKYESICELSKHSKTFINLINISYSYSTIEFSIGINYLI